MQAQPLAGYKRVKQFLYDFSVHGGAVGSITLDGLLPDNALVTSGMIEVITAVTSTGDPTVAMQLVSAEDILAETLKGALLVNTRVDIVPVGTAATMVKTATAAGTALVVVIGTAALTAGKLLITLEYFVGA